MNLTQLIIKTMKHTQGEWNVSKNSNTDNSIFVKSNIGGSAICLLYKDNNSVRSEDEANANAKLISTAPEMINELDATKKDLQDIKTALLDKFGIFGGGVFINTIFEIINNREDSITAIINKATI